jgi:nucleotide-binding universal stress UspA family protein
MKTKIRQTSATKNRRTPAASATIDLVPAILKVNSILVPVDFSESSTKALDYALSFAAQFGAKLTLLYVVEPVATPDFAAFPLAMEDDKVAASARKKLQSLCDARGVASGTVEKLLVRQGRAFHEIAEAARTLKSDLVIIATHGFTGMKHALLGSTAERVVRHAPCPVLVVRQRERQFA